MKQRSWRSFRVQLVLSCLCFIGGEQALFAQSRDASPYVPVGHWSREAISRLVAAGLIEPGAMTSAWPMRRSRIRGLLAAADERAQRSDISAVRNLAHHARVAFEEELGDTTPAMTKAWHARVANGWTETTGALRGGTAGWVEGTGWIYPGPVALADASSFFLAPGAGVSITPSLGAFASARITRDHIAGAELYGTAVLGRFDVWAGRRGYSFGNAHGEGLVLSEGVVFGGGGVEVNEPFHLPGFLRALGGLRASAMLARMSRNGPDLHPWFGAMNVSLQPTASLSIGLNRATLFGGSGNAVKTTPWTVLLMFVGLTDAAGKDSDFENQVASINTEWQTQIGSVPIALHGEFGVDDSGLAFLHVPGWIAGVDVPSLPFLHELGVGAQHTHLPGSCCGYPPWYQHGPLSDGWTDRGQLFGVGLGGEGTEWSLHWRIDDARSGIMGGGRFFTRDRGEENLLAPERAGRSRGGDVHLMLRASRWLRIVGSVSVERGGSGWASTATQLGSEVIF